MNIGMLWFDDGTQRTLEAKVQAAAAYYENKYGLTPNLCMVHPAAFDGHEPPLFAGRVEIRPDRSTLPDHFWIGVEEEVVTPAAAWSAPAVTTQLSFMEEQL